MGPEFSNVAEGRPAEQSTTWGPIGGASNAVDGITNKWYSGKSCTWARRRNGNWWTVVLDKEETVTSVVVHSRLDGCCYRGINGAKVWLEDSSGKRTLCDTISYDHVKTPIIVVPCGGPASKVTITQENGILSMCEVEVLVVEETVEPTEEDENDEDEEEGEDEENNEDEDEEEEDEEKEEEDEGDDEGDENEEEKKRKTEKKRKITREKKMRMERMEIMMEMKERRKKTTMGKRTVMKRKTTRRKKKMRTKKM